MTISGLTVSDGFTSAHGGGLYVTDTDLLLRDCSFSANHAEGKGGAIFGQWGHTLSSPSNFTIQASSVTANSAGGDGGGVYFAGNLDIIDSVISNNSSFGEGGGIFSPAWGSETSLRITRSTISGNRAVDGGGGLWCERNSCTIVDSVVSANESGATLESAPVLLCGGGIAAIGVALTVERTTVSNNIAFSGGAGLCSFSKETTIVDSEILSNTARANPAIGGGILWVGYLPTDPIALTLSRSTVSANTAREGAGIWTAIQATINASTISDNLASSIDASAAPVRGGARRLRQALQQHGKRQQRQRGRWNRHRQRRRRLCHP